MGSRWMALGGLGLVVGSVVLAPAVRAGTAQNSCAQPYPAWFVDDDISQPDPEGPSLEASLEHPVLGSRPDGSGLDTDLDGATDVVAWEGGTLVLERGDGVVRLEPPAGLTPVDGTSLNVGLGTAVGDLDGDGAPEFSVSVEGASEFMFFLVLGTVTPGAHPVDEVSVDVTLAGGGGVGDQDGDGIDDAIAGAGESGGPTSIVRGLDIVAPGAGGVLTEVPQPSGRSRLRSMVCSTSLTGHRCWPVPTPSPMPSGCSSTCRRRPSSWRCPRPATSSAPRDP